MTGEDRVEGLLTAMTLEEKVSLCVGADNWHTRAIPRLGIPALRMTDGPHGVRTVTDTPPPQTLPATCFPTGSALAATWDTDLLHRVGEALADETRAKGNHILLGPAVNIHRSPLGGRNFEYYSEDPYLAARMAVAYIKGLQSKGIGASIKHFACNNSEYERMTISSQVDERALHEIYYPAFKAAVTEAGTWTVMSSYNRINGVSAAHRRPMLTDLLKNTWGFTGFVVSDWGGVYDRVAAANAGCDLEMPWRGDFQIQELLNAVRSGQVSESQIDDKVRRILGVIARAGLFDGQDTPSPPTTDTPERRRLAFEAACEAMVLLKNRDGLLPLTEKGITSIAVLGPAANMAIIQGGGSARVEPYYAITPLEGLRKRCPAAIKLTYEQGCSIDGSLPVLDATLVSPPGARAGHGFGVEYFDNPLLEGKPIAEGTTDVVACDQARLPVPDLGDKDFSIRWSGRFMAPVGGRYRFSLSCIGRGRILLNGKAVVDQWSPPPPKPFTPPTSIVTAGIGLSANTSYDLVIEYSRNDEPRPNIQVGCHVPVEDDLMSRAVSLAARSDVAVVCVGLPDRFESEGYDRPHMELTGDQATLIRRVAAVNPHTVVVVNSGAPINMRTWANRVGAVLQAWYAGQEAGNAVAAILFGDVNPSGKLPMTFPKRYEDTPSYITYPGENDTVLYGEGIFVGYRYYDRVNLAPLFAFGHGLSYTTFSYSNLRISPRRSRRQAVAVSVDVSNTGEREGKEVVQLYVHDVESSLPRPPKELKGFQKVALKPGETTTVTFTLKPEDLAFYDPGQQGWVTEPGRFDVYIGSSSRDIRARGSFTITATGEERPRFDAGSRLGTILSDERGRAVIQKHLGALRRLPYLQRSYTLSQLHRIAPHLLPRDLLARIEADLEKIG